MDSRPELHCQREQGNKPLLLGLRVRVTEAVAGLPSPLCAGVPEEQEGLQ